MWTHDESPRTFFHQSVLQDTPTGVRRRPHAYHSAGLPDCDHRDWKAFEQRTLPRVYHRRLTSPIFDDGFRIIEDLATLSDEPPPSPLLHKAEVANLAKLRGACRREKLDFVRRQREGLEDPGARPFEYTRVLPRAIEDRLARIFDRLDQHTGTRRGVLGAHNLKIAAGGKTRELDSMLTCLDFTGDGRVTIA